MELASPSCCRDFPRTQPTCHTDNDNNDDDDDDRVDAYDNDGDDDDDFWQQ